jgi:transcription initiation factor IIE alpha subunit
MENKDKIFDTLKNSPKALKSGELAEQTGIDKKEVDKIIKVLKTEEKIFSPKNCFYEAKK